MATIERKINGTFAPVPGGYAQQINEQTTLFVPDFSARSATTCPSSTGAASATTRSATPTPSPPAPMTS